MNHVQPINCGWSVDFSSHVFDCAFLAAFLLNEELFYVLKPTVPEETVILGKKRKITKKALNI